MAGIHFRWQIRTFWWGLVWVAVGSVLTIILVGWAILAAVGVWGIYRIAIGLRKVGSIYLRVRRCIDRSRRRETTETGRDSVPREREIILKTVLFFVIPAKAGIHAVLRDPWMPAFAGMTALWAALP